MRRLGGRFVLESEIGAGGMSVIFLGKDEVLDRPVAVKVLRSGFENSEVGARFRREGRTAARLSHPNIVQVYDAGEDELDGREVSYIVMEYVPAGDLGKLVVEKGPLAEKELARIGADVASGLVHAHDRNIIHRDIKPRNILIDDYGRPKLADFGVARALGATEATRTGSYLGTASYSSPEQLRGEEITPKSDVYSLGCTLYEAAVGEPPFFGGPLEVAGQQLTKPPTPPRTRGAALSGAFEDLILACLAKDTADRPDAAGLQERLLGLSAVASGAMKTAPALGETMGGLAQATQEAGAARTARVASAAGATTRSFRAIVRGLRDRTTSAETSRRTLVAPARTTHQTFRRRGRSRLKALAAGTVVALAALLFVALVAPALTSPSIEEVAGLLPEDPQNVPEPPAETAAAESTTAPDASEPAPSPIAAEQAVLEMYIEASYRDRDATWARLSERLQDELGSKEQWAKQQRLDTFLDVSFPQLPKAEVSGDRAKVSFQVREVHTGGPKLVTGIWECVIEGGEWKLDLFVPS